MSDSDAEMTDRRSDAQSTTTAFDVEPSVSTTTPGSSTQYLYKTLYFGKITRFAPLANYLYDWKDWREIDGRIHTRPKIETRMSHWVGGLGEMRITMDAEEDLLKLLEEACGKDWSRCKTNVGERIKGLTDDVWGPIGRRGIPFVRAIEDLVRAHGAEGL